MRGRRFSVASCVSRRASGFTATQRKNSPKAPSSSPLCPRHGSGGSRTRDADGKATPTHIVGRIVDGFEVPDRETLDCNDQSQWKVGLSGKPEDPWRRVCYLPLVSPDALLTFSTSTNTGINSFWRLVDNYHWLSRRHPGQFPVVEIFTDGYDDKRYGWIETPGFKIVAWHGRPDLQQLTGGEQTTTDEPSLKDEMEGDEIPW
jgi:hypothetical protein